MKASTRGSRKDRCELQRFAGHHQLGTLVEEDDLKYACHQRIDFGATLSSASVISKTAREGNAHFEASKPALTQVRTSKHGLKVVGVECF